MSVLTDQPTQVIWTSMSVLTVRPALVNSDIDVSFSRPARPVNLDIDVRFNRPPRPGEFGH